MAIIKRTYDGAQDHHEQRNGIALRDTRTLPIRFAEALRTPFSGVLLLIGGVLTCVEPLLSFLTLPIAGCITAYVATRKTVLPLHRPASDRGTDLNNPRFDPRNPTQHRAGPCEGAWFIGWDNQTKQQLWVSSDTMTMHTLIPGSTGSGKTRFNYSLLINALAMGSGFTILDAKASNNLPFVIRTMARMFGRESDVRILNLLASNGDKKSHTWNLFASVSPEGLAELLLTVFVPKESKSSGSSEHFQARAESLIRGASYILTWARDHCGIPIIPNTLEILLTDLTALITLENKKVLHYWCLRTSSEQTQALTGMPDELLNPIRAFLRMTGGFSQEKSIAEQDKVREQHSYVVGGFGKVFTHMGITLGHIFQTQTSDIDLEDIIFNRRIFVILLPSLENHESTNAGLAKLIITAQRYALAGALGTSIEGDYDDKVRYRPSAAKTPYIFGYDEAGMAIDKSVIPMFAQARELNIGIVMSFQEIASFYSHLGRDQSVPILGNPKLKILLNLEDSGPTREWVEQVGGKMSVAMLPGFEDRPLLGGYADQQRADIREVNRVTWSDIQGLNFCHAIILFRGKRIYASLMDVDIKAKGYSRLHANAQIALPATINAHEYGLSGELKTLQALFEGQHLVHPSTLQPLKGILGALYSGLAEALKNEDTPEKEGAVIFKALAHIPHDADDTPPPYFPLLYKKSFHKPERPPEVTHDNPPPTSPLFKTMCHFDTALGIPEEEARRYAAHYVKAMENVQRAHAA
ncbi:type IV secretory system conjugative DNA transfer family protein [Neokomagataea thailandica]|uniref:IcmO protein n=1 Tax=Neokomagataea tanensis NBRC 106556 TaxID=1223519 RepID=A0ABQ0QKS0_9PROT|nr:MULTISPECIES: type IV secretion system DNA-binding domain-containing protein [Neokomagataea]GBR48309.1 IcmO protein [Neokomagataea tanensis NBRC 106556]